MAEIVLTGAEAAKQNLEDLSKRVRKKLYSLTRHYGVLTQNDVRARARRQFDVTDYDRSIRLRMRGGKDNPAAVITSTDPQSNRLEYGFTGVDRLGRSYHQPPRPHFRPALAKYGRLYRKAVQDLLR